MKKQIQNFTKLLMMLLGMAFFQQSVVGQVTINMGAGPTTTNSPTGTLFDDGGPAGVYMNNANYSLLISVPGADSISLTFSAFNTELDWDYFQIYQGNSAAGLHITNGSVPPASLGNNFAGFGPGIHGAPLTPFTYRVAGSEMFLRFRSDGSVNAAGWQATWAAKMRSAQNDAGVLRIDSPAFYQSGNRNIVATISNFGVNQITSATVNWSVNGLIQTPATFNGLLDTMNGSGNRTARVN